MKMRLLALFAALAISSSAFACPMCKDSVPNKENASNILNSNAVQSQNISGGINASVYFMLAGFLSVLGLVSTVVVKGIKGGTATQRGFEVKRPEDRQ